MAALYEYLGSRFTWVDYVVFCVMLGLSAGIGIFYGCRGKGITTTKDFLMAGKSITTFPISLSLLASFTSGISYLGISAETYERGFIYCFFSLCFIIVNPITAYVYLPVFWDLQVTSANEYLHLRFNRAVRILGSLLFMVQMSLYMSIVIYTPALALAQVTGVSTYASVGLVSIICIFYTTLGGMKAVIWTDALQMTIMLSAIIFIVVRGSLDLGGVGHVWEIATEGNRTHLGNFDIDPRTRHSMWSLIIGGTFTWLPLYAVNQAQVQRYLCVQKKVMAVKALWINIVGLIGLVFFCGFGGLVIYARYVECDPISSGHVSKPDQLMPLFVMDALGTWRGLPGLFVAGLFSGSLSTVSTGINSLAAITLEDFVRSYLPNLKEKMATNISKGLSILYGLMVFVVVFIAENLGNVATASLAVNGMVGGPLFGMFTLGMFVPWINSMGAFCGGIAGVIISCWISLGYQVSLRNGDIIMNNLPVTSCYNETDAYLVDTEDYYNVTIISNTNSSDPGPLIELYKVSYLYYSVISFFTTCIIGTVVSVATGRRDVKTIDPKLISPIVHNINRIFDCQRKIGMNYRGSHYNPKNI